MCIKVDENYAKFLKVIFQAVTMTNNMFWDVTPCNLVGRFADCVISHPSVTYIGIPFQGAVHIQPIYIFTA